MKKLSIVLLAVLLVASLIISCDNSTKAITDELVEVQLGTQAGSRALASSVTLEQISDPSLTWHYSAFKKSQTEFKTGETSDKLISLGTTETFSQGKWDFKLWAMKNDVKVYSGELNDVLITKSASPVSVIINVSPYVEGSNGSVQFSNVKIQKYSEDTNTISTTPANVITLDGSNVTLDDGNAIVDEVAPGPHTVVVSYVANIDGQEVVYASESILITVYSGRTTVISGNVAEETTTAEITVIGTAATVNKELSSTTSGGPTVNNAITISAPVTPAKAFDTDESGAVSAKTTQIYFEEGAFNLNGSEDTAELKIDTTSIEDSNFTITGSDATSGLNSVAGLDIALKVNNSDVTTFNNTNATITTYIAKNLTDVGVRYKNPTTGVITSYTIATVDSDPTTISGDGYYIASSGKLVFKTTHLSEYYVVARAVAYIKETNNAYSTLNAAIEAAKGSGKTVILLKNVTLDNGIANEGNKSRKITFRGNGTQTVDVYTKGVEGEGGQHMNYQRGSSFTFENLTIQASEGLYDGIVCDELTFRNCTITGKLNLYGKATFINCTFENDMADQYSIWTWGGTDVKFEGCTFNTNGKAILLFGEEKTTNLTVNNCTFNDRNNGSVGKAAIEIGDANYGKHNNFTVVINGSSVKTGFANGKNTDSKLWANKNSMDTAHLTVTIDGSKVH